MKTFLGAFAWIVLVGFGFGGLAFYETRPGIQAAAPPSWPSSSKLARDPERWTLLLFLHPRCPCSEASLHELDELLGDKTTRFQARIICCKPEGVPDGWERTATWRQATTMRNVDVTCDDNDRERACFGAVTSGQVLVYDPSGTLRYSGGITRARGQQGASAGRTVILSLLRGESSSLSRGPVFGCPLVDPESSCSAKGSPCPDQP